MARRVLSPIERMCGRKLTLPVATGNATCERPSAIVDGCLVTAAGVDNLDAVNKERSRELLTRLLATPPPTTKQ